MTEVQVDVEGGSVASHGTGKVRLVVAIDPHVASMKAQLLELSLQLSEILVNSQHDDVEHRFAAKVRNGGAPDMNQLGRREPRADVLADLKEKLSIHRVVGQ
jgi:hypothetical protein